MAAEKCFLCWRLFNFDRRGERCERCLRVACDRCIVCGTRTCLSCKQREIMRRLREGK